MESNEKEKKQDEFKLQGGVDLKDESKHMIPTPLKIRMSLENSENHEQKKSEPKTDRNHKLELEGFSESNDAFFGNPIDIQSENANQLSEKQAENDCSRKENSDSIWSFTIRDDEKSLEDSIIHAEEVLEGKQDFISPINRQEDGPTQILKYESALHSEINDISKIESEGLQPLNFDTFDSYLQESSRNEEVMEDRKSKYEEDIPLKKIELIEEKPALAKLSDVKEQIFIAESSKKPPEVKNHTVTKADPPKFIEPERRKAPDRFDQQAAGFDIIQSYIDVGDNFEIQKAKIIVDQITEFKNKSPKNVKVSAYFGDYFECISNAESFLKANISTECCKTPGKNDLIIQAFLFHENVAFVLKAPNQIFDCPTIMKAQVVDFIRYLIDFTNALHVTIPRGYPILEGTSKLKETTTAINTLEAKKITQNSDFSYSQITVENKTIYQNSRLELLPSYSSKLLCINQETKGKLIPKMKVETSYWRGKTYKSLSNVKDDFRYKNTWSTKADFVDKYFEGFSFFVKDVSLSEFRRDLDILAEHSNESEMPMSRSESISEYKSYGHYSSENVYDRGYNNYAGDYPEYKEASRKISKQKKFNLNIPFSVVSSDILDKYCEEYQNKPYRDITLNFVRAYPIKFDNGEIKSINIVQDKQRFSFSTTSDSEISVSSFYPINDEEGAFVLRNSPVNKSTLYSYKGSKESSKVKIITELATDSSIFVMNPEILFYVIYDNQTKRAHMGRLSKSLTFSDSKEAGLFLIDRYDISHISSLCIITKTEQIVFIDDKGRLYEYTHSSSALREIQVVDSLGNHESIKPSISAYKYELIQATSKIIMMGCEYLVDLYDMNFVVLKSIQFESRSISYNMFTADKKDFLICKNYSGFECFSLNGVESSIDMSLFKDEEDDGIEYVSNPILDYLYLACDKFGSPVSKIGSAKQVLTKIYCTEEDEEIVFSYFKAFKVTMLEIRDEIKESKMKPISIVDLFIMIISRIPIHIASIQDYTLVPLNNGKYDFESFYSILNQKNQSRSLVFEISESIKFGHFEDFLNSWEKDLNVISIVGKQSSGKSYILNRMYGTRFNVAGTRCTDGIWMTLSFMKDEKGKEKLLIVLDCEGLFSIVRTATEETKLCIALAAVSDIFCINQDLSYNRNINTLMTSLSLANGKLKGKQLFKGNMAFFVRDVPEKAFQDAQNEFDSNMKNVCSDEQNFIIKVFNGRVTNFLFTYFEQSSFEKYLEKAVAKTLKNMPEKRWKSGSDFVSSLKIVLSQLMVDDDLSLDDHKLKIYTERKMISLIESYLEFNSETEQSMQSIKVEITKNKLNETSELEPEEIDAILEKKELKETTTKIQ